MEEEVKQERVVPVYKASLVKRTLAGVIDFFVTAFLYLLFLNFAIMPLAKTIASDYDANFEKYISYYENSGLVVVSESDGKLSEVSEEQYLSASKNYYEVYCAVDDGTHACSTFGKTLKEVFNGDELLTKYATMEDDGKIVIKEEHKEDEGLSEAINEYVYKMALQDLQSNELFLTPYNYVDNVILYARLGSLAISATITYLVIPLIAKRGRTMGKLTFKLSVTNSEGFKAKTSQIVVRFLAFVVLNYALGLMSYMLVPLVSFTLMIFTKRNSAIHDYLAVTMVVDDKASIIYDNREAFNAAKDKEERRFAEIDESRKDYYDSLKK